MRTVVLCADPVSPRFWLIRRGVMRYVTSRPGWRVPGFVSHRQLFLEDLDTSGVHGVIAFVDSRRSLATARRLRCPLVNISAAFAVQPFPRVCLDHARDGWLAAEHFLGKGFRRFAFLGTRGHWGTLLRLRGFRRRLSREGHACASHLMPHGLQSGTRWSHEVQALGRWLQALPRPLAAFCSADQHAALLLEVCTQLGLAVPGEVAILGVNNDAFICENTEPPLSSIAVNWDELGYEAARLLGELMEPTRPPPRRAVLVPPLGIIERHSTNALVTESPRLRQVCAYLRQHRGTLRHAEAARRFGMSRRTLQRHFREALGTSPQDYLQTMRLEQACRLLTEPPATTSVKQISFQCGFTDPQQMYYLFRRRLRLSPTQFRRAMLRQAPAAALAAP